MWHCGASGMERKMPLSALGHTFPTTFYHSFFKWILEYYNSEGAHWNQSLPQHKKQNKTVELRVWNSGKWDAFQIHFQQPSNLIAGGFISNYLLQPQYLLVMEVKPTKSDWSKAPRVPLSSILRHKRDDTIPQRWIR